MTGRRQGRAISTVVDVTFALLLVSASIAILAVELTDDEPAHDPIQADRTAETLAAATRTVEYTLDPVRGESHFSDDGYDYERSTHGTLTGLLADAAVTNAQFPDGSDSDPYDPDGLAHLTRAGEDFATAVDGAVREALTSAGGDAHVVAVWTPYDDSAIRGRMEAGADLPPGGDTSTATLTVPSKMPAPDEADVERAFRVDGYSGVSELIAGAIVEGYFPTGETQLALERDGLGRALAVYRYQRMAEVVDHPEFETDPAFGAVGSHPVSRTQADAATANAELQADLATMIEVELSNEYPSADAERIASAVSVGEVTVTVTTWNE
ncbi:DUF7284 family protein [Halosimplex pelagicum]|uniref:Uncharacterized protein n=1 Tax=Halosimplex pelagicum TaxID=869886 RepID=A0A7D5PEG7_9EURY|nr:hypothetical protein [Halosimplex pelagicum]QLH81539.1 hypothetical protein HZS54_07835 [Halosimplex pelagicum]